VAKGAGQHGGLNNAGLISLNGREGDQEEEAHSSNVVQASRRKRGNTREASDHIRGWPTVQKKGLRMAQSTPTKKKKTTKKKHKKKKKTTKKNLKRRKKTEKGAG